jgi:hypothetical protein
MKHLGMIQTEFLKEAAKWDQLSLEAQKQYLKEHPKSKRRVTARPGKSRITDVKAKLESKKSDLQTSEKFSKSQGLPTKNQIVKLFDKPYRFLGEENDDNGMVFVDAKGELFWSDKDDLGEHGSNSIDEPSDDDVTSFKASEPKIKDKEKIKHNGKTFTNLGEVDGEFGFGGGTAAILMDSKGQLSTVDPEELYLEDESEDDEDDTPSSERSYTPEEIARNKTGIEAAKISEDYKNWLDGGSEFEKKVNISSLSYWQRMEKARKLATESLKKSKESAKKYYAKKLKSQGARDDTINKKMKLLDSVFETHFSDLAYNIAHKSIDTSEVMPGV